MEEMELEIWKKMQRKMKTREETNEIEIEMEIKIKKWEEMKENERSIMFKWIMNLDNLDVNTLAYSLEFELKSQNVCNSKNLWNKNIEQHRVIHVYPSFRNFQFGFNNLQHFNTITGALDHVKRKRKDICDQYLIFLHPGTYDETIEIETDNIALIGVAQGKVAESVIIQSKRRVMYVKKHLKHVYIGYLTLKLLNNDVGDKISAAYCLQMGENSNPTIDHCIIENSNLNKSATVYVGVNSSPTIDHCIIKNFHIYSAAIYVSGEGANPLVKNCNISYYNISYDIFGDKNVGIYLINYTDSICEDNINPYKTKSGLWIEGDEKLILYQDCLRHRLYPIGIYVSDRASGHFENNNIHHHGTGFMINNSTNLTIEKNNIHNCQTGVHISDNGSALIKNNEIYHNERIGINILHPSPMVQNNNVYQNCQGISFKDGSQNKIKENKVFRNSSANFLIVFAWRLLRKDEITVNNADCFKNKILDNSLDDSDIFQYLFSNVQI